MKKLMCVLVSVLMSFTLALPAVAEGQSKEQSDTWLEARLVTTYALNRHLSVFDIDTEVKQQKAYLSGVVASDIEKDLAEEVARSVEGITEVENNIVVSDAESTEEKREGNTISFSQKVEDLTTTAEIKSKLLANQSVAGLSINVDTAAGRVTLNGEVNSEQEKALAEKIAENVTGVASVENKLNVLSTPAQG